MLSPPSIVLFAAEGQSLLDTGTISTSVSFSGTQVLCGIPGEPTCNNVNAGMNLAGSYSWSNSL